MRLLANPDPSQSVTAQLLAHIRAREFTAIAKLFSDEAEFEAWTPSGRWTASDARTAARIIEVWFTPGTGTVVQHSYEAHTGRRTVLLECEIAWKLPSVSNAKAKGVVVEGEPRVLRQVYLLTIKNGKITAARVYCAGLHTNFPDVDLEKRRRTKGLTQQPSGRSAAIRSQIVLTR